MKYPKWEGKNKAVTFSFDDGVKQDEKTIEILDSYGLKATFNLNSGRFGQDFPFEHNGKIIERSIVFAKDVKKIYKNHEVALHTVNHINLTTLKRDEIIKEVLTDKNNLEDLCGYKMCGMAYPCGGVNNDDRVAEIIRENTDIKYARGSALTYGFDLQENLLRFKPSIKIFSDKLFELADRFLSLKNEEPQLLYVCGHTYEFDMHEDGWETFEKFCKIISGKTDIFYGNNREVLLDESV